MQTVAGSPPEHTEPQASSSLAPADRYWRNVLTGQRLLAHAQEQQRVARAQREALAERRGAVRASLDQTRARIETALEEVGQEPELPPLTGEEKAAMRVLIGAVRRWAAQKIAEQNESSESSDPFAEAADAAR